MRDNIRRGIIFISGTVLLLQLSVNRQWFSVALLLTFFLGMYLLENSQKKAYSRELMELSDLLEMLLQKKSVSYANPEDDTLFSKIFSQIQRIDEMNCGNQRLLKKERDDIKRHLAEISHQLRTPLANMETYLALMEDTSASEDEKAVYLKSIAGAEQKISFLVETFILAARMEHGIIQIRKCNTNLKETVAHAVFQVYKKAEKKNIYIEIQELPNLEKAIPHDTNWICESIYNLLDNSIKYSPYGPKILITMTNNEMFTEICVGDFGIGIREGEENKIFQRFYRGDNAAGQEGYGMGLYITRDIIQKHDGFLRVRRKKQGLSISVFLPKTGAS